MATEFKKIVVRKGTRTQFNTLEPPQGNGLLEGEFGYVTDENKLYIGVGNGLSMEIASETHMDDETNPHNVTAAQAGAEPAFTKNTGFNKDFGTTEGTIAEGNHTHEFADITSKPTTIAGFGITDADTSTEVDTKISTAINDLIGTAGETLDTLGELATQVTTNTSNITTNTSNIATNTDNISGNTSGLSSLSSTVSTNAANIATNETNILGKQDALVAGTNYKTVNGVDIFDMEYNNTGGDAYLRRTAERTLLGSASTDNLRTIVTFNIGNNYSVIAGSPYPTNISSGSVIIYQEGQPDNNTAGDIGYVLFDITNGDIYRCTSASPSTNYYTWQFEEGITAYSSFNITELDVNTIYRFSGNSLTSDWQISLTGGANIATQGTLETADPNVLPITSNGLRSTYNYQILIRYVYEDYATGLHYSQYQTVHTPDLGGNDLNDIVYFKAPNGNITYIEAYTLNGATLNVKFGTLAQVNDVQKVYIYGLT